MNDTSKHVRKGREEGWEGAEAQKEGKKPKKAVKGISRAFKEVRLTSDTLQTPWAVNDTSKHVKKGGRRAGRGRGDGGLKAIHGLWELMTKITYLITVSHLLHQLLIGRGLDPCFATGETSLSTCGGELHSRDSLFLFGA